MDGVNASVVSRPHSSAADSSAAADVPAVLAHAIDLARAAVCEVADPSSVGEHLGIVPEAEWAASHRFVAHLPGYRGWEWNVVVAACPGSDSATISEFALLPGRGALLAPPWVPWEDRIDAGDLAPGDILPPKEHDERLVPGSLEADVPDVEDIASGLGLSRKQVLSVEGRASAAERWLASDFGPEARMAKSAPGACHDCGFYLPLAGPLGHSFGVCGNEYSADGHVVHARFGCGAHSDSTLPTGAGSPLYQPYDDGILDVDA
ncbi:DUF3027 domain-containing protein [Hoyosella sp. G463]|uniref:DUF3027 domain-containing protein n=1 Tax=Lolliginicoccus lacisalsi TaxID=2742202 RepID=A0A927PLG8_9ACTN|nr:DUF3027 domain-containing protein [Lolliginicoccus lacisalsi]